MKRPKLGQHFLRDTRYAERSVEAADLRATDVVLEVGPGKGVLTRLLAARCAKVVAVELDEALADTLDTAPNVELIRGDAVTAPLPRFDACVSNLPYQISSPFLFRLLALEFRVAVLLVQREFADRLVAKPGGGDYGRLSVNAQRKARVEIVAKVPPGAFDPPPQVDSAIVRIVPRAPDFEVVDEALFDEVVLRAFSQRRKKLRNTLGAGVPFGEQRPEELSPAQFSEVVAHLSRRA